jgi:excinuclease ABC subunit C
MKVRRRLNNAAMYFGPYASGLGAKETLRFVRRVFPLRTCRSASFLRFAQCDNYQ